MDGNVILAQRLLSLSNADVKMELKQKMKQTMKLTFSLVAVFFLMSACSVSQDESATNTIAVQQSDSFCKDVNAGEFQKLLGAEDQLVLDVRTPDEFNAGHVENAVNLNFYDDDFATQVASLDKSKTVMLYCQSGGRSSTAKKVLQKAGFPKIYHLESGYRSLPK